MSFKDSSYLELRWPFCSEEQNLLCNCGREHREEQFCEIIFKFGSAVQEEMSFKIFLIWSSGSPSVRWSETICAILKHSIMGNIHVKLYVI